jgi:hypothetical protein
MFQKTSPSLSSGTKEIVLQMFVCLLAAGAQGRFLKHPVTFFQLQK